VTGIASSATTRCEGANAVFKYVNKRVASTDARSSTSLRRLLRTPASVAPVSRTATQTHALLGIPVFATVASLGTPTQDSVRALRRAMACPSCTWLGSQDWNNAHQYPGLFGWQPSYNEESKIFAKYSATYRTAASASWTGRRLRHRRSGRLDAGGITPTAESLYSVDALVASNGASIAPTSSSPEHKCTIVVLDSIPAPLTPHWVPRCS